MPRDNKNLKIPACEARKGVSKCGKTMTWILISIISFAISLVFTCFVYFSETKASVENFIDCLLRSVVINICPALIWFVCEKEFAYESHHIAYAVMWNIFFIAFGGGACLRDMIQDYYISKKIELHRVEYFCKIADPAIYIGLLSLGGLIMMAMENY